MFSLAWLVWYLGWLKNWLHVHASEITREVVADSTIPPARMAVTVAQRLYPLMRAVAYLAWWGQVMFEQENALSRDHVLPYVPSMPGVNPQVVKRFAREEMRVRDGKINASIEDVADRLASRAASVVHQTARDTVSRIVTQDAQEIHASHVYTQEHGHPLVRFEDMIATPDHEVGRVFEDYPELKGLHDAIVEAAREEHKGEKWDLFAPDVLLTGRDVKNGELLALDEYDKQLAEVKAEAYKDFLVAKAVLDRYEAARLAGVSKERREQMSDDELAAAAEEHLDELWDKHGWQYFHRASLKFARVAVGSYTCGFCLMLCARGAVYRSDTVLEAKVRKRKGKKAFTGRWTLNAYHEHCDCLMVSVHDEADYPGKDITEAAKRLYESSQATDPAEFTSWLAENQSMVREVLPGVNVESVETWEEKTQRFTRELISQGR